MLAAREIMLAIKKKANKKIFYSKIKRNPQKSYIVIRYKKRYILAKEVKLVIILSIYECTCCGILNSGIGGGAAGWLPGAMLGISRTFIVTF